MIKYVHIDYRTPRTSEERSVYAFTEGDKHAATVFINVNKNRKSEDVIDTFFHEMAHVFFAFHKKNRKMSCAAEEKLAQQVGRICAGVLK